MPAYFWDRLTKLNQLIELNWDQLTEWIDFESYKKQVRNNVMITNLGWGGMGITPATMDLNTDEDYKFPLIDLYFYRLNGKYVKCHERNLQYILSKEKKRIVRTFVTMNDFSWTKPDSLLKLLKALQ